MFAPRPDSSCSSRSILPARRGTRVLAGLCGLVLLLLSGCDGLGLFGGNDNFDVPSERLVSMTAVYEETHESGRPVHRLVVADMENPSNYQVLSEAGTDAGRSCFGPEKRRLLFEDNSETNVGSRAPIKLLDLETREVRDLGATGTLKGCVWRADGSGFYYAAGGPAGLTVSTFYDLETDEAGIFAQSESGATVIPYGRKGRDSILVLSNDSLAPGPADRPAFYFVDAETGEYLTQIENEHLRFVPREDPDRGAWKKSAFTPAYNDTRDLIAFRRNDAESGVNNIAVTDREGSFMELYRSGSFPEWGPNRSILFTRRSFEDYREARAMVIDTEENTVRPLAEPQTIDEAEGLRLPDY